MLTDERATKSNILKALREIFSKAKPTDRIIFYFSGHGVDGYFCQYDVNDKNANSFLKHSEVQAAFKMSNAGVKLCIADACQAGSIRNIPSKNKTNYFKESGKKSVKDNILVFMSSRSNQYSVEDRVRGTGVFTYYLINSFQGKADTNNDKKVTAKEMYTYVRYNVTTYTRNIQTPVMFGRFSENTVIASYK